MATTSDDQAKSLCVFAIEALVGQVQARESNERKSILPEFFVRGDAAVEVLTGVRMKRGTSSVGEHKLKCYSVKVDAYGANESEIYKALDKFSVQPPGVAKGLWDFTGTQDADEKDSADSIFLFRQVFRQGVRESSSRGPTPVKIALIGDYRKSIRQLINAVHLDPLTYTFKPSHLNFRVYSPTLILVQLLYGLPVDGEIATAERSIHLILLLLEKGFQPAFAKQRAENDSVEEDEILAQFSFSEYLKVLRSLRLDVLNRADQSAAKLSSREYFAPVCANLLGYRDHGKLEGTTNTSTVKQLFQELTRIFQGYKHTIKQVAREEQARAYQSHYSTPPSTNYYEPPPSFTSHPYTFVPPPHSSVPPVPHYQNSYYAHARYTATSPRYGLGADRNGLNPSRTW